jgi:hypothetical protein
VCSRIPFRGLDPNERSCQTTNNRSTNTCSIVSPFVFGRFRTMALAAVIPASYSTGRRSAVTYARRRLLVLLVIALALVLLFGAGHVVANRGGAPASASAIRPESPQAAPAAAVAGRIYVVQPGDTLWSIGERFHGSTPLVDYVDRLVAANGGATLQVAQPIPLP